MKNDYRYENWSIVNGRILVTRIVSSSIIKYTWHRFRGLYEYGRGNSYEYNDVDRL